MVQLLSSPWFREPEEYVSKKKKWLLPGMSHQFILLVWTSAPSFILSFIHSTSLYQTLTKWQSQPATQDRKGRNKGMNKEHEKGISLLVMQMTEPEETQRSIENLVFDPIGRHILFCMVLLYFESDLVLGPMLELAFKAVVSSMSSYWLEQHPQDLLRSLFPYIWKHLSLKTLLSETMYAPPF